MKIDRFRIVLDTNVVLAHVRAKSHDSPNKEIIHRWARGEFDVLCALNGHGTHIVTYDRHLLYLTDEYSKDFLSK